MCWVYILKNKKSGRFYIGSTNNLDRRIKQHDKGQNITTHRLGTDTLVYTEVFGSLELARQRERKLKSYKSHKYIEWLIGKMA